MCCKTMVCSAGCFFNVGIKTLEIFLNEKNYKILLMIFLFCFLLQMAYPTTTPTEISEAIRVLDEREKKTHKKGSLKDT